MGFGSWRSLHFHNSIGQAGVLSAAQSRDGSATILPRLRAKVGAKAVTTLLTADLTPAFPVATFAVHALEMVQRGEKARFRNRLQT